MSVGLNQKQKVGVAWLSGVTLSSQADEQIPSVPTTGEGSWGYPCPSPSPTLWHSCEPTPLYRKGPSAHCCCRDFIPACLLLRPAQHPL